MKNKKKSHFHLISSPRRSLECCLWHEFLFFIFVHLGELIRNYLMRFHAPLSPFLLWIVNLELSCIASPRRLWKWAHSSEMRAGVAGRRWVYEDFSDFHICPTDDENDVKSSASGKNLIKIHNSGIRTQ